MTTTYLDWFIPELISVVFDPVSRAMTSERLMGMRNPLQTVRARRVTIYCLDYNNPNMIRDTIIHVDINPDKTFSIKDINNRYATDILFQTVYFSDNPKTYRFTKDILFQILDLILKVYLRVVNPTVRVIKLIEVFYASAFQPDTWQRYKKYNVHLNVTSEQAARGRTIIEDDPRRSQSRTPSRSSSRTSTLRSFDYGFGSSSESRRSSAAFQMPEYRPPAIERSLFDSSIKTGSRSLHSQNYTGSRRKLRNGITMTELENTASSSNPRMVYVKNDPTKLLAPMSSWKQLPGQVHPMSRQKLGRSDLRKVARKVIAKRKKT
jgi:hypothetical protein